MFSFGFNSFWNSMHGSRAVQELLNKPDLQLDELLEEDGLLSELKTLNQRLMSFLLREENFKKLTSYVITEPDPEEAEVNRKKGYKFPFVCADVLSSDSQAIVSEFFKSQKDLNEDTAVHKAEEIEDDDEVNTDSPGLEKEGSTETSALTADKSVQEGDKSNNADANCLPYIDYLFTFLDSNEMNLTSAGYFAKIANNLFAKKPSELIAYLYEQRPVLLEKMANHISSKSIAEFLAKILTFESSILSSTEDEIYNTKRKDILKILIKKLDPKQELEEINNTAYLICEVLGKYNTMHCSQEILQHLLDKSTIDYFFELLKTKDSTVCCAVGLILGNIFAYYILINTPKMQYSNEEEGEAPAQNGAPQQLQLTEDIPLIAVFIENLGSIIEYIVNTSGKAFPSQYGAEVTPFGSARLKLVELIIIAMKANNQTIYAKLIEYGFLDGLLQLFARYEWNNMLHNQVEKIVTSIIDSDYHDLKASLFEKTKILDFIINTSEIMEYTMGGKHERKIRKGYIGQLTRIANRIAENKDPEILKYTEAHEGWKDFVDTQLSDINQKNNINLGGKDPRGRNEEEEIDSHNQFSGMMQQFSHYFANKNQAQNDDDDDDDDNDDNEHDNDNDNDDQDNDNENDDQDDDDKHEDYSQTIKYIHHGGDDEEEDEQQTTEAKSLFTNNESHHVVRGEKEGKSTGDEEEQEQEEDDKGKQAEQQSLNQYNIQNEQSKYNAFRNVKIEEYVLDPEYNTNSYWKRDNWHSAEDILAELEGK